MGFFSWITQDTGRSIPNYFSDRDTFKVTMLDNKGNKWVEENYEGYGVFGGKDFYELLAEMNGVVEQHKVQLQGDAYTEFMRSKGIDIAFKDNGSGDRTPGVLYPTLVEDEKIGWLEKGPESCKFQGYFYEDDYELEEEDISDEDYDFYFDLD